MNRTVSSIETAIDKAHKRGVLIFASASNVGRNFGIAFPAKLFGRVFCIGSTDGLGVQSNFNPLCPNEEMYSIIGEAVSGAFAGGKEVRLDGTSTATPIAAGLAAVLIGYTRQFMENREGADTYENMRKLFLFMSFASKGKDYRYLAFHFLFETEDTRDLVKRILSNRARESPHLLHFELADKL